MWCTRWYLPLFILPFSRASPFFLIAFLFSLTLHARPCLYCVVMLLALAQSSCYWQPVPADELYASLTSTHSSSSSSISSARIPLSTYSAATSSNADSIPETPSGSAAPIDGSVRLIDRCWCDLSFGLGSAGRPNFFAPYDVSRWEARSLDRERKNRMKAEKAAARSTSEQESTDAEGATATASESATVKDEPNTTSSSLPAASGILSSKGDVLTTAWGKVTSFMRTAHIPLSKSGTAPPKQESATASTEPEVTDEKDKPSIHNSTPRPLPPWSVDLRPYGMGIVLDFGWERVQ